MSSPSSSNVTVQYNTSNGSAISGSDYSTTFGTATIFAGQNCANVTVPITDDATPESTEMFNVNLTNPTNGTIADPQGTVTILDNDSGGGGCNGTGDNDGDGVCNALDCFPWNPYLPGQIGAPCDDGNPNTTNDVIVGDECNCQGSTGGGGTPSITINNVTVNENAGAVYQM